jgi:heme exporter protein C
MDASPPDSVRPPWGPWALGLVAAGMILTSLYLIFAVAPVEAQMGIVQKIFYFHVPSAFSMYLGFGLAGLGSAIYLVRRSDRWDALAVAGAEVGVLFCVIVLSTGPLWARKAWGVWWTWDPRLTTTLLAGMVFVSFLALRSFGQPGEPEKRFASALALLGLLILPVIHYSVQRWRGQHPTVISEGGGGLDPDMQTALWLSVAAFLHLAVLLLWLRTVIERQRQRMADLRMTAAERGLLEDA